MATILFYQFYGDSRELSKTLANPLSKSVNIRADIDIYNPILLLQDFDCAKYNYFSWDSRYYFINDIQYTANNIWRITSKIDVLMTYKDAILSSTATKLTQSQNGNYIETAGIPMTAKPSYMSLAFPNEPFGENVDNYVLIGVAGKIT